jgi:hypothetical protein
MKKFLPHLLAILVFLALTFAYFSPLFSGKELKQSDINNWKGMSKEILDYKENTGKSTYWTNSMFGGMPAYQISAEYPGNLMKYVDLLLTLGLPDPASYIFLLMAGFYFLLLVLKVDHRVAILGAIGFAFSSYFLIFIGTGHNSKAHALGYMAPVIAGIILTYRGRMWAGVAVTAIALALEIYSNHLQITYYLMLMTVILILFELYGAIKEKRIPQFIRASGMLLIAAILAVSCNITNLWATQEYGKYSTRGPSELTADKENQTSGLDRDYITQWSFGIGETMTLLIPNFKGGASEPIGQHNKDALKDVDENMKQYVSGFGAYFGDQPFTGGPSYIGAIMVLLFVIGLFTVKGKLKWWLVIISVLAVLLSWGHNLMSFTNLFLDFVPGYDKFRAVTTIIVLAQFSIPLLGMLAVNQMITDPDYFSRYRKKILYALGIVTGLVLLITITPGTFTSFYSEEEYNQVAAQLKGQQGGEQLIDNFFAAVSQAREQILVNDALRSLMLVIAASLLIYTFLRYRYRKEILIYGLLLLVIVDLFPVDKRYLSSDDFVRKSVNAVPFAKSQADDLIHQDTTSYRVLNLAANTFNDAGTSYYHQSIGGYHGAKLKRYKEVIDYSLTPEIATLQSAMQKKDPTVIETMASQPVINMLNTKYIIYNPDAQPFVNPGALGNAWFVREIKWVPNADAEIAALRQINPSSTAVIDERFKEKLNGFSPALDPSSKITLRSYNPDHLVYSSSSPAAQLAVFSEIHYDKGWNVYVDNVKSDYVRANYILRAMKLPAGNHTIEWKFEPEVVATGGKIALSGSILLILFFAFSFFMEYRKPKAQA